MKSGHPVVDDLDGVDVAVGRFLDQWQSGQPDLLSFWSELAARGEPVTTLAALIKADLQYRYERGERPAAAEYFERFPELRAESERVLSLVYEEFCLREERGDQPDPAEFCERYAAWTDSLASQLRYHKALSQVAGTPPTPPRYPRPGDRFRHFHLTHVLGRGGAAQVYRARDEQLGLREVALKISADRGSEPAILGRLVHPNIVNVHSVVYQPETRLRGLCMTYEPGLPLDEVIRRLEPAGDRPPRSARALWEAVRRPAVEGPADPAPAGEPGSQVAPPEPSGRGWSTFPLRGTYARGVAWVGATLARALHHAHTQGIFHRDVKPANILLTHKEGPQLLDFNLAHDPHSAVQAEAALRGGTLPYMAPEQLEAFLDPQRWDEVGAPADIYALGLVLRELLTGKSPDTPEAAHPLPRAIRGLLDRRARLDANVRGGRVRVPHALQAIVAKCLAPRPSDRYADAAELAEDLDLCVRRRPLRYAYNPSHLEEVVDATVRNAVSLGVGAFVGAFVGALVLGISLYGPSVILTLLNWEHKFLPAEQWREFRQAVTALEAKDNLGAHKLLELIGAEAPDSAVVAFYDAVALEHVERHKEAAVAMRRAWKLPNCEVTLSEWASKHPTLASQADYLAFNLAKSLLRQGKDDVTQRELDPGELERTLNFALRLDPNLIPSRVGLSALQEERGDYAAANEQLDRVISPLKKKLPEESARKDLFARLQARSRLKIRWAQSLQKRPKPDSEAIEKVRVLYNEALSDVDDYKRLEPELGTRSAHFWRVNYLSGLAHFGLGQLAESQGLREEADRCYLIADDMSALVQLYLQNLPDFLEFRRKAEAKVRERGLSPHPSERPTVTPAH